MSELTPSAEQDNGGVNPETARALNSSSGTGLSVGGEVRVARLNSLVAVRGELGRLYREARKRHGRYPDALTATRLATILGAISTSIELQDLEQRILQLERERVATH